MNEFKVLQDNLISQGFFTDPRALGQCDDCQLFENVTIEGRLFVYRGQDYDQDTGLRFKELEKDAIVCPECGKLFCPYEADLVTAYWDHDASNND